MLITRFGDCDTFAVFNVRPNGRTFCLFLAFFRFDPIVIAGGVEGDTLLRFTLGASRVVRSLMTYHVFQSFCEERRDGGLVNGVSQIGRLVFNMPQVCVTSLGGGLNDDDVGIFGL